MTQTIATKTIALATNVEIQRGKKYLLWDGDCGFCARSVELARRLNAGDFELVPYQSVSENTLRKLGLSRFKCSQEVKSVSSEGKVLGGAFAFNYFLWFHPQWRGFIALLYALPICILAEVVIYRAIAQNRGTLSRVLGLNACAISFEKKLDSPEDK